jgi:hypothetical protein
VPKLGLVDMPQRSYVLAAIAAIGLVWTTGASAQTFNYTGSLQTFVVPTTGVYDITAFGAVGGNGAGGTGGSGAEIGGLVDLYAGTTLTILVGGIGATNNRAVGGGGGSFVALGPLRM